MSANRFTDAERSLLKEREQISVNAWCARHRAVVRGSAQGLYNPDLTPYVTGVLEVISRPWVRKVYMTWSPQTGKSATGLNFLCWAIANDPSPIMVCFPDEKSARRFCRRQLLPTLRATVPTGALLSPRSDDMTSLRIVFRNGADIIITWASSPAALASESIKICIFDECAKYGDFAMNESDPFTLAEQRMNVFPYSSKALYYSTPNMADDPYDRLVRVEAEETQRFLARCPACGTLQFMDWERISWGGCKDPREVLRGRLGRYRCEKCFLDWDDRARDSAVLAGVWKPESPVERATAIHFGPLPSWYSRFVSISKVASDFLKAQEDPLRRQGWQTQHRAIPWADAIQSKAEDEVIANHRIDLPAGVVPEEALCLTLGADTQRHGVFFVVHAWLEDLTSVLVTHGHLSSFDQLENMMFATTFSVQNSQRTMSIWRGAVDVGGTEGAEGSELSHTEMVYEFLWKMKQKYPNHYATGKGIHGIKGSSRRMFQRVSEERFLDPKPSELARAVRYRAMVGLRFLDTFELKTLVHFRLGRKENESQRFLLNSEVGVDFVRQLLAEQLVKNRNGKQEWRKIRSANHYLDATCYSFACTENAWQPSFRLLAPATKEALKLQPAPAIPPPPAPLPPPKSSRPAGLPDIPVGHPNGWLGDRSRGWFHR